MIVYEIEGEVMRIYLVVVEGKKMIYIVEHLTNAVELANDYEEQGYICEIHSFAEDKIIEREFWKKKNENKCVN